MWYHELLKSEGGTRLYVKETGFNHVGFWARVLEYIIDAVAIYIVVALVASPLLNNLTLAMQQFMTDSAKAVGQTVTPQMQADYAQITAIMGKISLIFMLVSVLDFVVLQGLRGQSLGKMVLGHRLVRIDGSHPGPGIIIGRFFAFWLSSMMLDVGLMMTGWNKKRQGLHDILAGTYVVRNYHPRDKASGKSPKQ